MERGQEQLIPHGALSLYELNRVVAETIEATLDSDYWVVAELADVHERGGHCYMDLIEKDEKSNTPIARAQARCWRSRWLLVKMHFERTTGQLFTAGIKVLLKVRAQFHENYGFSWIVNDVDPSFTMGDMARRRQEIIQKLTEEGVIDDNKQLPFPLFAQRIAVISSQGAAGYGDFQHQLLCNDYGLRFYTTLFPSVMQGEGVSQGVIAALDAINDQLDDFDVVVIIRGGGATSDMSGFDTLELARHVANFPLPVITGIGHDRDECVLDIVAHRRVKTPTAAAVFLIEHLKRVAEHVSEMQQTIANRVGAALERERLRLLRLTSVIPQKVAMTLLCERNRVGQMTSRMENALNNMILQQRHRLQILSQRILPSAQRTLTEQRHRINMLEQRVVALDPEIPLKRGYSITLHNGHFIKDASLLHPGDIITTLLAKGVITAEVKS
ncbi:MAG: exodeoxyribonuclease VII large subunit [Prevotella sp.]|nr:exodeoxyribonuclease VII large subunit [Prevotella sp.]